MHIPPGTGEDYYLRMLLNIPRECTYYEDIRTVDTTVYPNFGEACYVLGRLEDDKEYIDAIKKANQWASADYVRRSFVVLLLSNFLTRPEYAQDTCWSYPAEDVLFNQQKLLNDPRLIYF